MMLISPQGLHSFLLPTVVKTVIAVAPGANYSLLPVQLFIFKGN